MGPSDSLLPARSGYLFPVQAEASCLASGPQGLPSSWSFFQYAPSPSTPESPLGRLSIILPKRFWFHPLWEPDHSRFTFRGRFPSSLSLRLAPLPPEAPCHRSRGDSLGRLHVFDTLLHG
jgi:hypothetical protein